MPIILIPGGTGLVGGRLSQLLTQNGYEVNHLSRAERTDSPYQTYQWDVQAGYIEEEAIRRADYIINLAGANIGERRWTEKRKKILFDSRIESARLLKRTLERLNKKPKAYISASGISYYNDSGEAVMQEDQPAGQGFLPDLTLSWENAAREIGAIGIRTVMLRTSMVLSTQGGALPEIMLPFHFFVATYFGNGRQWYSWIHIDDLCRMYLAAIEKEHMAGPYNATSPQPERNKAFIQKLAKARNKPLLVVPAPAFAIKLVFGEMAATVLDSTRASAAKIEGEGFIFQHPDLLPALKDVLQRNI